MPFTTFGNRVATDVLVTLNDPAFSWLTRLLAAGTERDVEQAVMRAIAKRLPIVARRVACGQCTETLRSVVAADALADLVAKGRRQLVEQWRQQIEQVV